MKKTIIILVGVAVLAGAGYAAGQVISKKKSNDNFVQLEDGRRMKINGAARGDGAFNREGERPDVIGRIKSIDNEQMVIEKFEMPNRGGIHDGGAAANGEKPATGSERPGSTISGEEAIMLSGDTSYVKGPERGMGRRGGGTSNAKLEEISKSDLREGYMVSVWLSEDGSVAQRVMIR